MLGALLSVRQDSPGVTLGHVLANAAALSQCLCGRPEAQAQHPPPPPPLPMPHDPASLAPAEFEANVENFFSSLVEPQWGHLVPAQSLERTSISLSFSHFPQ